MLSLLADRVGREGSVIGVERDARFADLARRYVAERSLSQVEVIEADAFDTRQPRASFDGAHMRLVLVNVPDPQRLVREMTSLVRPGGWVASFEADLLSFNCDPPSAEWARLLAAYKAYSDAQGIDLCIGRRTHALFRAAGVTDIHVEAVAYVSSAPNPGHLILLDFINNVRDKMIELGFIQRDGIESDIAALERHLSNPQVFVTSHLFYLMSGRVPR